MTNFTTKIMKTLINKGDGSVAKFEKTTGLS